MFDELEFISLLLPSIIAHDAGKEIEHGDLRQIANHKDQDSDSNRSLCKSVDLIWLNLITQIALHKSSSTNNTWLIT